MKLTANAWRLLLLALCVLGVALTVIDLYTGATQRAVWRLGFAPSAGEKPYLVKIDSIHPNSPASRAGLRQGEILDLRPMSPQDRYRFFLHKSYNGESLAVYVVRPSGLSKVILKSVPVGDNLLTWDVWLGFMGGVWMLGFAAILAYRRPENHDARTLAFLLIGLTFFQILWINDWITPWPALDAFATVIALLCVVSYALLATYSETFARPPSTLRRALLWCSYAVAWAIVCIGSVLLMLAWMPLNTAIAVIMSLPWVTSVPLWLPYVFPLLCATVTAFETRDVERTKYLWAFVPLAVLYVASSVNGAAFALSQNLGNILNPISNIASILAPLGLTYSLLNRRLLDIGFVLNRAAVFSGVSIVLVGMFVLVEWLLSDWMQSKSHTTNVAVSGALALALGLSIRFVHAKVEHFVDNVMFRKRREDVEAIRKMAREAPYITDRTTLLARSENVLAQHADADSAAILLDDNHGHYGAMEENDPALVALRAEHVPLDLHAIKTSIKGEWAYPLVVRGALTGALVVGPKRSLEAYAPDESAAIMQLAQNLATALDVLSLKAGENGVAEALQAMSAEIAALRLELKSDRGASLG